MSQAVVPVTSEQQPLVGDGSSDLAAPGQQNALMAWLGKTRDSMANLVKERKPWSEVFDRSAFTKPASITEATGRLRRNLGYFKVNYALGVISTTALCFLASPSTLLVLLFLAALWFVMLVLRPGAITVGGRTFGEREKFFGLLGFSLVVAFFLSSIGAVLFYALALGVAAVALHGAMRVPDDLFLDEAVPESGTGILSFLGLPTTAPMAAAGQAAAVAVAV